MAKHSGIKDGGEYFVISPTSRKITVPHSQKSIGAVGDHCSEQVTFMCPQMVDGHDVSQCAHRYVTWFNVNGEIGHDELRLVQVEQPEEGMIYLAWTIRDSLTVAKGVVKFSVHFEDRDGSGATLYRWSTATCKDCDILESINGILGAYEAIYVSGETLVISDYTLVNNNTLNLESKIIPEGKVQITENGTFDVYKYAQAEVSVDPPSGTLIIDKNGTYDVSKYEDALVEVLPPQENVIPKSLVSVVNNTQYSFDLSYTTQDGQTLQVVETRAEPRRETNNLEIVAGTILCITTSGTDIDLTFTKNIKYIRSALGCHVYSVDVGDGTITIEQEG
jgi:hypothetical protein